LLTVGREAKVTSWWVSNQVPAGEQRTPWTAQNNDSAAPKWSWTAQ